MLETNFTKGEWNYDSDELGTFIQTKEYIYIAELLDESNNMNGHNIEQCMANAKLIAAAPELLKACDAALYLLECENIHGKTRLLLEGAIKKALY